MAHPALIIGLGGTGQWALTYVKKYLLKENGGVVPPNIALLAINTTSQSVAETNKEEQDLANQFGAVRLDEEKELISIKIKSNLAQVIRSSKNSDFKWFSAESFMNVLSPAKLNIINEGVGQTRQFGRLAVFREMLGTRHSQIISRLKATMQDLQSQVSKTTPLEIIIVSSIAGGTSSSMFIDIALLARMQAQKTIINNYDVHGLFVLPSYFTKSESANNKELQARAFADWREFDRFMGITVGDGLQHINYHESNQDLRVPLIRRTFDKICLIEPSRKSGIDPSPNIDQKHENIFLALVEYILSILDNKVSKVNEEFITISDPQKLQSYLEEQIQQISNLLSESQTPNLHVFPAEINARSYELGILQLLGCKYRALHPEVVALLEEKERFELFFHAYALGFIRPNNKRSAPYWLYQLPTDKEPIYLTFPDSSLDKLTYFDPFKIIHNFVDLGIDQRPGSLRRVDWETLKKNLIASKGKLGKTAFINLYQYQIDNPQGLVRIILKTTPNRHFKAENENSLISKEQEYEDLANITKFIFLKTIRELE